MNIARLLLVWSAWLVSAAALAAAVGATAPEPTTPTPSAVPPQTFAARYKEVQERIAALFAHRNQPPPPPDPRYSPFRLPHNATAAPAPGAGTKVASATESPALSGPAANLILLQQAAAALKVGGSIQIAGRTHLVINSRPYQKDDLVPAVVKGETVYLRITEITRRTATLSLRDAEMTLKY